MPPEKQEKVIKYYCNCGAYFESRNGLWKHGNRVNEPCTEWRPRSSGPQGEIFGKKKIEIARKTLKKMRIEHA